MNDKQLLDDIKRRLYEFTVHTPDPWRRVDNHRLLITRSGFGIREDMTGKLVPVSDADFIRGRTQDHARFRNLLKYEAHVESDRLWDLMRVHRDDVIGKKKKVQSRPIPRSRCRVQVCGDRLVKPDRLFVSYRSPKGRLLFREIIQ